MKDTIRRADFVGISALALAMPGAISSRKASPQQIADSAESLTGRYLSGD